MTEYTFRFLKFKPTNGQFQVPIDIVGANLEIIFFAIIDCHNGEKNLVTNRNMKAERKNSYFNFSYSNPNDEDQIRIHALVSDQEYQKALRNGDYHFLKTPQSNITII